MSFSPLGYYVRGDFATLADADAPVDVGVARALANNAQWAYDMSGQVLVNMRGLASSSPEFSVGLEWSRLLLLGPFPARVRPDGRPYKYRVRVAVARNGSANVVFRFAVGTPASIAAAAHASTLPSNAYEVTINTATITTSAPTDSILTIPDDQIASLLAPVPTVDAAANVITKTVPLVHVGVYARSASGTQGARLAGLYVAEYVGNP